MSRVMTCTVDDTRGFLTREGGFCTWGDGDTGLVSYDHDVLVQIRDEETFDLSVFHRIPKRLVLADSGLSIDDDNVIHK